MHLSNIHSNAIDQLLVITKHIASAHHNLNHSFTYDMDKYYPEIWEQLISKKKNIFLSS